MLDEDDPPKPSAKKQLVSSQCYFRSANNLNKIFSGDETNRGFMKRVSFNAQKYITQIFTELETGKELFANELAEKAKIYMRTKK